MNPLQQKLNQLLKKQKTNHSNKRNNSTNNAAFKENKMNLEYVSTNTTATTTTINNDLNQTTTACHQINPSNSTIAQEIINTPSIQSWGDYEIGNEQSINQTTTSTTTITDKSQLHEQKTWSHEKEKSPKSKGKENMVRVYDNSEPIRFTMENWFNSNNSSSSTSSTNNESNAQHNQEENVPQDEEIQTQKSGLEELLSEIQDEKQNHVERTEISHGKQNDSILNIPTRTENRRTSLPLDQSQQQNEFNLNEAVLAVRENRLKENTKISGNYCLRVLFEFFLQYYNTENITIDIDDNNSTLNKLKNEIITSQSNEISNDLVKRYYQFLLYLTKYQLEEFFVWSREKKNYSHNTIVKLFFATLLSYLKHE